MNDMREYDCTTCGKHVAVAAFIKGDTCTDCEFTVYLRNGGTDD